MKMLSLKILTIIYKKKKVFLTFTSFYIQNFLRVKSLKNNNLTINEWGWVSYEELRRSRRVLSVEAVAQAGSPYKGM